MATCPTCRTRYSDDLKVCAADGEGLLPDEAVAAADTDLPAGQTVGEYRIEGKLGEGGFGAVYRAVHPLIGKAAAVKVLHKQFSSNPQMVSRFIAEARAVNQIRNRNIIDIFSFGSLEDGRQYYVMELLDGMTLDAYLKKNGRMSPEVAIPVLRGIARALDAAHATGIAHRDLKPENVFLLFDEDGVIFPKLLDFGIAKLLGDSAVGAHKTRTGTPMGTPYYMSPEQCRGRNVDHRTDIYSFGILVFEVLVGKVPFDGEDVMEILVKNISAPAPRLSDVCPALPPALDAPVLAFLEKDPAARPLSVGAGLDALAIAAAGAGFDVKVSGRKVAAGGDPAQPSSGDPATSPLGSPPGNVVRVAGGATPAEGAAQTMISDAGKTVISAEAAAKPQGGRAMVYGAVGAALLLAAIGVGAAVRPASRSGAEAVPIVKPSAQPSATAAKLGDTPSPPVAMETPRPPPTVTPVVTAEPAALPAEVELTIDATPKVLDVYLGGAKIGTSAAPVKIKRGDARVKLTFKAAGYAPQEMEVPAAASSTVAVKLVRAAAVGKKSDLEY